MFRKILLPTFEYPPQKGGIGRCIKAAADTFGDRVRVLHLKNRPTRVALFKKLFSEAKSSEQIWVHYIFPIGTVAYVLSFISKMPYTIFLHGMDFDMARRNRVRKMLARAILKKAVHVVANSESLAEEAEVFAGRNVLVVYPCVSDRIVKLAEHARPKRSGGTLLTVSRLVSRKGHVSVLKAIKNMPDVHYVIAGDGPALPEIKKTIHDLGMENRVELVGEVNDDRLSDLYSRADVFIMPTKKTKTDREGFGIVYLEAALFGLPVVASDHPGVNEAVLDRKTGLLVKNRSEIGPAIRRLLNDEELRDRLGKAGRRRVLNTFTREKQFTKLKQLV